MSSEYYKKKYIKYKLKYYNLKNKISDDNKFKKFSLNDISDIECGDKCKIVDNKIKKMSYGKYLVSESEGRISLYDNNAKYSEFSIDKFTIHFGYLKEMIKIIEKIININRNNKVDSKYNILILGFGLGGAPLNLSNYEDFINIDSIDLDYDLFKLFKKITKSYNINVSNKLNYIHGDAVEYLKHCNEKGIKYDFILDDIFESSNKVDYDLELVYNCLNTDGIFFMNVHYNPNSYLNKLKQNNYRNLDFIQNNEYLIYAQK